MTLFFAWLNLVLMFVMGFTYTIGYITTVQGHPETLDKTVLVTGLAPVIIGCVFSLLVIMQ